MGPGTYASNFGDETLKAAPAPSEAQTQRVPWYNNPGFWSKVGATGAALLPKWSPLKSAGEYAASYHNAQQLDLAQRKVLANAAAGVDPMTDMTDADTMGLSAEQIANLNKTGMARQSELIKEEREGRLAENTLATGEAYREYTGILTEQAKQKMEEKTRLDENWATTLSGVESGTIKSKYITPDTLPLFKMLGREESEGVIKKMMEEQARFPKTHIQTDKEKGEILGIDQENGIVKWKVQVTPEKKGKEPEDQIGFNRLHKDMAIDDYYNHLLDEYVRTNASDPAAAEKFRQMWTTIDPTGQKSGREILFSSASPELRQRIYSRIDEYNRKGDKGYGELPPVPALNAKEKTDIPKDKTNKSPQKTGSFLEQNEAKIVRQLTGKPAGWKRINGIEFYWDGNGGISAGAKGGK